MGCIQHRPEVKFVSQEHEMAADPLSQQAVIINRRDTEDEEDDYKMVPRIIEAKSETSMFTLNMVTLRVTNEISMLLHRSFSQDAYTSETLQRKRLGSWWYSAIKNHQYSGIVMQNNIKITIKYEEDGLSPTQKIENKIDLVSGLFYTKIDFNDDSVQITFDRSDIDNYYDGEYLTKNPYFQDMTYNEDEYQHMIEYRDINKVKQKKCSTSKQFEYIDNLDILEKKDRMFDELRVHRDEIKDTFIYISDVCTDLDYRQKGIATAIWLKLFNLYEKGTAFGFHVRFDNKAAHQLYFKLGFQHVGIVEDYYKKDVHAWKMMLIL